MAFHRKKNLWKRHLRLGKIIRKQCRIVSRHQAHNPRLMVADPLTFYKVKAFRVAKARKEDKEDSGKSLAATTNSNTPRCTPKGSRSEQ